jgi:two-component system, cell cycle sensor histidine kinase and response regulator CckA
MDTFPRWWKAILALAVTILLAGAAWYFQIQHQRFLKEASTNLDTITQMKINQLVDWRSALMREATVFRRSPYYLELAEQWDGGPRAEDIDGILSRLRSTQQLYFYLNALYVDAEGKIYVSLNNQAGALHEVSRKAMAEAFRTGKPVLTDLYLYSENSSPQFDVVIPFYAREGNRSTPNSAFVFQYDARQSLYPLISFWPVHSHSAETLIVRRDGDSVLFLNELRHQKGAALRLRIPLDRKEVPAVKAVSGQRGIVQGKDYRGTEVISIIKAVPDSSWIMIAKVDESEVFSELRRESVFMLAILLFLIALISTVLGVLWQRNEKAHYRALFEMEAALRKSETLYRNALDSIKEGCQIIDFNWRPIFLNATALKFIGRTKEEVLNHTLLKLFPGLEETEAFAAFQRCMKERKSQYVLSSFEYPDGIKKWFEHSIQPIPEGIFILINEITERKLAEDSLRDSEEQYRLLFEHMIQGAFRMRADGTITDVNPAALRMSGVTKEEFLSRNSDDPAWNFVSEDGTPFPGSKTPPMVALKTGAPASATHGVWNVRTKSYIWVEVTAIPEFTEGDTKPYQVLVTIHDVTDRKRAEAAHDRLASAIEQSGESVVIIDTNRIVQYVNPAFEITTGKDREEAIGHPLPLNENQNEIFYQKFWSTLESGKSWKGRLINTRKDGTQYIEEATVSPVFNAAGIIVNYVSITKNITDLLKLQEEKERLQEQFLQAQKMESVGRLAGGVAHDFNNMLNVISGYAQLSLDEIDSTNPLHSNLQEIKKAAHRSAELTRQLLAFARRQTIAPRVLNLNSTIAGSLNMLQRLIGEDIDLAWMPGHNLWPVHVDPAQIDQILANLAVNARDAIDKQGKITIETENAVFDKEYCEHHQGYTEGKYVMLAMSDDGCGMSKEVVDHLFEPFFTTKKVGKGTGLGLSTVYGIVKQNEGFINVYSEPGRGSTFKIYIRKYPGPELAEGIENALESPKEGTETILLVEDEEAVLSLAKVMLERLGYTVVTATTPTEAIRLVENYKEEIHLLLVDVVMPEMTGRDLAERLTQLRPKLRLMFMSGYTANVIAHRGVLDDGVFFIQKPFSARDLAAKVRKALNNMG